MWRNVETYDWSHGLVSPTYLNCYLWCGDLVLNGTSPAVWVQQEPSDQTDSSVHLWWTERKISLLVMTITWFCVKAGGLKARFGHPENKKKESWVYKKRTLCLSLGRVVSLSSCFPPHKHHSGEVAAKATALTEETMTSCDAAAYTWHSSITELLHSVWCADLDIQALSSVVFMSSAWLNPYPIIWHPFYLGAASSPWNSELHCLALCDPCPLPAVNRKPHGIPPCFGKCHIQERKA